jgi:hypothetical protein
MNQARLMNLIRSVKTHVCAGSLQKSVYRGLLRRQWLRRSSSAASEQPPASTTASTATPSRSTVKPTTRNHRLSLWYVALVVPSLTLGGVLVALDLNDAFRARAERLLPGTTRWLSQLTGKPYGQSSEKDRIHKATVQRSRLLHAAATQLDNELRLEEAPPTDKSFIGHESTDSIRADAETAATQIASNEKDMLNISASAGFEEAQSSESAELQGAADEGSATSSAHASTTQQMTAAESSEHEEASPVSTKQATALISTSTTLSASTEAEATAQHAPDTSELSASREHILPTAVEMQALVEQLSVLVLAEALRVRELVKPLESQSKSGLLGGRGANPVEQRRQLALMLMKEETALQQDLERALRRLEKHLRQALEPQILAQLRPQFEKAWSDHEALLRQQMQDELDTQRLALQREQVDRLLELQMLMERVEARALRDRLYKQYAHWAQRTALLWQALAVRLTRGEPFFAELSAMQQAWRSLATSKENPESSLDTWQQSAALVECVLSGLAPAIAMQGIPPASALQERFLNHVFPESRVAALMPANRGVWGYWLARIAAWLKTNRLEENLDQVSVIQILDAEDARAEEQTKPGTGLALTMEQRLLWARRCVERGDLRHALQHLQQIPADSLVSRICKDWMTQVERYLVTEQAVRIIRAESTSVTAALC